VWTNRAQLSRNVAELSCYKLRTPPDGPVADFDDAIPEKKQADLQAEGPVEVGRTTAKLFLSGSFPTEPPWGRLLRAGFGNEVHIPKTSGASAVLVVRFERSGSTHYFAFTFGYGFMLLRPDCYERGFGLKTSLNVIFEDDDGTEAINPARLRSVDAKRVGPTILRSRHQVAGSTSLEELDVDVRRDLLNGVTGTPVDRATWGQRITGKDALHLSMPFEFHQLDHLCGGIADAYGKEDYKVRFAFVDDMQLEKNPVLRARLEEEVLGFLQAELIDKLDLAPPALIDWERVAGFRYHADPRKRKSPIIRRELRLSEYVSALKTAKVFDQLTVDRLKSYEILSVDGTGQPLDRWSAWHCLFGELSIDGSTYVLDDGDFYSINTDYLSQLDADLNSVGHFSQDLPDWIWGSKEKDYNEAAAISSSTYLLLDRRTVKIATHTTQIEICDLLTDDGCFIHVKRGSDGSSSLSHLFAQGFVSGDLFVGNSQYRTVALQMIKKVAAERAKAEGDESFIGRFESFSATHAEPSAHEVVYAMLGKWDQGIGGLPFFSKVMLRQIVDDLQRRNLKVSFSLVPAVYGQIPS
jgi:uncharacterized protein (TIGR04141 family)